MIVKQFAGTSPNLDISIAGVPVDYESLMAVEITLSENMHDTVSFEMAGIPTRAITEYIDQPVRLLASLGGSQKQLFVGRVVDVVPTAVTAGGLMNASPFQTATIRCMGYSYEMRGAQSRVWNDYKLKDIVSDFSELYGFSATIPLIQQRFNLSIQSTESDWQFLVRECTRQGYALTMHGTHMHIFDPYEALSHNTSLAGLTTLNGTNMDATTFPGQILEFKGRFGERNPDGRYKETIVSVLTSAAGNSTFDVSSGDGTARFQERLDAYGTTYGEAVRIAETSRKAQYDYEAKVNAVGMLGTLPGGVVKVDNYQNSDFDGYWYVREIKHRIATGAFISELSIARNSVTQLEVTNTEQYQEGPAPAFYNGLWSSSSRGVYEY